MRLLIIGNLSDQFGAASVIASKQGAKVRQVPTKELALETMRSGNSADLIMIDAKENIAELIEMMQREHISTPIVACGFDNSKDIAVAAIKQGASEYITLPPNEELIAALLTSITKDTDIIFSSAPSMQPVLRLADQVAPSDATVLITGQSGTGKEVMSKYIHQKSNRATRQFISVNCAAIPDNLLESELFGHEKGAFTGAIAKRVGKFEEANGGTLLLDEISEIDIKLQAKLLRAIQEKEIDRVGGAKPVKLDLRIIATSNRDLALEVREGRFREDLYFRLNVINLHLKPLRERPEDVVEFSKAFVAKYCKTSKVEHKTLSDSAFKALESHPWPGNVRELENTIYRAVLLSPGSVIEPEALMLTQGSIMNNSTAAQDDDTFVGRTIESVEKEVVYSTLGRCLGDEIRAANMLGISIEVLKNKLKQYAG